ncbi:hypothetical protein AALP_AA3G340000 [Arabis alpina]|uniref:Uncharacterized protein n=1 Tax=Arabis alpina TaxID=50452 RepID=A0A087HDH3_ARAAL|nr:hypothetical protein AALP_AA3G340000 [Arabis alpina]
MPGLTMEIEPHSQISLSCKYLKRALDLYAPDHSQFAPPDPESKKIRLCHKIQVGFGGVEPASKPTCPADHNNERLAPLNALALRADRTIKIWDVATGVLKLTLTGDIGQVRGLVVNNKHTYMFSCSDDKQVKCWDLEHNKVIRSYHGHLHGVYCLALHPTLDVLLTGGRDSLCRVWDIRTKLQVFALSGHTSDVFSVFARPTDPQVVTGSSDSTIKLWDLRYGKTMTTLTHHKHIVRAMAPHPKENAFVSASADNIKKFSLPRGGEFCHNMLSQQRATVNAVAVNEDGVMATGGDRGGLWLWDWKSGHSFQQIETIVQPGSLESEAGIYAACYDKTGSRLVTCEADKTIKMWKEDENATPETHPLNFRPPKEIRRF